MLVLVGHDERSFSLQINITKDITSIVQCSPLVLGLRFVATSLYALRVDWLVSAWYGFSAGGDFRPDFSS